MLESTAEIQQARDNLAAFLTADWPEEAYVWQKRYESFNELMYVAENYEFGNYFTSADVDWQEMLFHARQLQTEARLAKQASRLKSFAEAVQFVQSAFALAGTDSTKLTAARNILELEHNRHYSNWTSQSATLPQLLHLARSLESLDGSAFKQAWQALQACAAELAQASGHPN